MTTATHDFRAGHLVRARNREWVVQAPDIRQTDGSNLPREAIHREVVQALDFLQAHSKRLEALAHERAQALLADHRRVREAARNVGQYSVNPCWPVDVTGV